MCGITGYIDFNEWQPSSVLDKMTDTMDHRGPDGRGTFRIETSDKVQIGLGHRRLSIIDLRVLANQPMHYNGLHIVFNGEIYNYKEIKEQLVKKGHFFQTSSDTELILHAWYEWGEESITHWRGMFSIVLYDENRQEIICIRDRAGIKPIYYYWHKGLFLFGSELKSLMAHPSFEKTIDADAVASFLQYGYISHPSSIFKNTHKLSPGHLLRFDLQTKNYSVKQYWNVYDYYNKPKLDISLPEAIAETERILNESFQYRMVADVPIGVFLSGGYDSSCVTALLQKDSSEKIKTFTIGMTEEKLDEAPFAKQIAKHLGTNHTELYCKPEQVLEILPSLPYYYDEPFADSSAIPTILVSKLARKDVTVALSADAGDEIFAGYRKYDYLPRYSKRLRFIPTSLRKLAGATIDNLPSQKIPYWRNTTNFHRKYDKMKNLLNCPSPKEILKYTSQAFNQKEINSLFSRSVKELNTLHTSTELRKESFDTLSYMMAVDYQSYLVDDILHKVDSATMSVSLEGREPFLDQHIIQWAAQLPSDYKYHNGQKKHIIKEIVHKYIPKEIMIRPKMGFNVPVESWLRNELRTIVMEYLSESSLNVHGLFNWDEVNKLVDEFYMGRNDKYLQIWYLLMFQMWYKQWM